MDLKLTADLGYRPSMGALMDAIEQAHLAGFGDRDCEVSFSTGTSHRVCMSIERMVSAEPTPSES